MAKTVSKKTPVIKGKNIIEEETKKNQSIDFNTLADSVIKSGDGEIINGAIVMYEPKKEEISVPEKTIKDFSDDEIIKELEARNQVLTVIPAQKLIYQTSSLLLEANTKKPTKIVVIAE